MRIGGEDQRQQRDREAQQRGHNVRMNGGTVSAQQLGSFSLPLPPPARHGSAGVWREEEIGTHFMLRHLATRELSCDPDAFVVFCVCLSRTCEFRAMHLLVNRVSTALSNRMLGSFSLCHFRSFFHQRQQHRAQRRVVSHTTGSSLIHLFRRKPFSGFLSF